MVYELSLVGSLDFNEEVARHHHGGCGVRNENAWNDHRITINISVPKSTTKAIAREISYRAPELTGGHFLLGLLDMITL